MFLCVLNEKKGLTAQSIQKSITWRPISIKYKFSCFETGERSLIDLTLQDVIFFISGLNSFTIFEILLFSFTLKSFIYFIPMWQEKPQRGVPYSQLAVTNCKSNCKIFKKHLKEFVFSKMTDLQSVTLLKSELLCSYF